MGASTGTALLVGSLANTAGQVISANKAGKTSGLQQFSLPESTERVRGTLADLFSGPLPIAAAFGQDPLASRVRSSFQEFLDPSFRESIMADPHSTLADIREGRLPAFRQELERNLLGTATRFGSRGHRVGASSDLFRIQADETGRALNRFEGDILGLFPELQRNQLAGAAIASGIPAQAGAFSSLERFRPLELATMFANAPAPGGQYVPGAASGLGTGLSAAGDTLSTLAILNQAGIGIPGFRPA